jgi:hypothetical protein
MAHEILDVAVVGGGVSGVYSAWRLVTSEPKAGSPLAKWSSARPDGKPRVKVFEASNRIGGRLLSLTPPGMPHVRCELGGMRYMSTQKYVRSLIENELELEVRLLPVDEPENVAYLRGRHLRLAELADPDKVPYQVDWAERGQPPSSLVSYAMDQIIPGVTKMHGAQLWDALKSFMIDGRHVYEHGFWNLLALSLSREGYMFAQQSGGYDTTMLNWNAADTIVLNFDFAPTVTFHAVVQGYERVPAMVCELFQAAGGALAMETRLASFDEAKLPDGTDGVKLVFDGETEPVFARSLILAMPRRSLELLGQTGAVLGAENGDVHELIRSVTPIPLFKIFVCYHAPWWTSFGVTQGRSVTDLPIRQCYYWGTEGQQPGGDPANLNSALMATYDDTLNVSFWGGLRDTTKQAPYETRPNRHVDPHPGSPAWDDFKAPAPMVDEIQRQLKEMHGARFAPAPYAAAYKDWGEDPYGGGVNFWNIHAKSWEVIPRIAKPKEEVPVYICGEAYSNGQGWVEGALETAELVLQTHFDLAPPAWVTE